jgi:hypothetical protein
MKRHITVILGVAALSLGVFVAPASADGPPDETVLIAKLVFATSDGSTLTVNCQVDDESDNWEHVDAAECAGLGDVEGRSLELDLDVTNFGNGACNGTFEDILWVNNPDWEMDDYWESTLIFADIQVVDIYSEGAGHNPAVFQVRTDCLGYGVPGGDSNYFEVCKDFSDDSLLAVLIDDSPSANVDTDLQGFDDFAVEGLNCVEFEAWTVGVPYHAFGVIATYDDSDDPHVLTALVVIPSIYSEFGEDLATNLLGLANSVPPVVNGTISFTEAVPAGYTSNLSDCTDLVVSVFGNGEGETCTIVNTLIPAAPPAPAGGGAAAAAGGASSGLPSFTG